MARQQCIVGMAFPLIFALQSHVIGSSQVDAAEMAPAPITTYELKERQFDRESRLTGSVGLYRQEAVGFEVGGRIESVLDLGKEVHGPAFDEGGAVVSKGGVIATLDDTRYRLRLQAFEAKLRAINKDLKAQRIDVERVAQANLKAAEARLSISASDIVIAERQVTEVETEVARAQRDYDRQVDLRESGSAAFQQRALDDAKSAFDGAVARRQQREALLDARRQAQDAQQAAVAIAEATISFKQAQVAATEGRVAELQLELNQARVDLEDTVLLAPFAGRVTAVQATRGAIVTAGQHVVTLTLMDPIQIRLEVSADMERRIRTGDRASVYPKNPIAPDHAPEKVNAIVFEKGAVANPDTRTFRIDLIARNRRFLFQDIDPSTAGLPVITDFLPVARRFEGEEGPLFVPIESILREEDRTSVLRLPGVSLHDGANRNAVGKHMPEKIEIDLGNDYFSVVRWNYRSLRPSRDLREGDFLVLHPEPTHASGLVIDRPQWLLRPGDLAPVRLALGNTTKGFYVPIDTITKVDGVHIVYLVVDGTAVAVRVEVHETHGELRRISGEQIDGDAVLIVDGIHRISSGQPVKVIRQVSEFDEHAERQ